MSSSGVPYVFLLAASHSGSTLTAMLLNAHEDVTTIGELTSGARRNLEGYRCSCRRVLTSCPFWTALSANLAGRFPAFNLADFGIVFDPQSPGWLGRVQRAEHRGPLLEAVRDAALALSPSWRRHLERTNQLCTAVASAVLQQTGARVIVDSSKLAHRLKFVRRVPGLDVKVIHLVRDGRAVALTYMDEDNYADATDPALRRGGRGSAVPARQPMPMSAAADEWVRAARSAEYVLRDMAPTQWMRLRYEDLCTKPGETLDAVFSFIGVDPARRAREFRAAEHHIVGNGMRMDTTSQIVLDERWRTALTAQDLAAFDAAAGAVNRAYYPERYERSTGAPRAVPEPAGPRTA